MHKTVDDREPRSDFLSDPSIPTETQIKAREALARYVERQKLKYGGPPPEGYGLDGRPLQRGRVESGELRVERTVEERVEEERKE